MNEQRVISQQPVSCAEIMKRFPQFFVDSIGSLSREVSAVASPETATADSAVFLANQKVLIPGLNSQAGVLVVSKKNRADAEAKLGDRTLLIATNVELAMSAVVSEYFLKTPYTNAAVTSVHPSATIHPSAEIGSGARIGPGVFIGARVKIGQGAYIGASSVIEDESTIGESTVIHPQVFIGHSTLIGKACEVHPQSVVGKEGYGYAHDEKGNHFRIPHQGRVILEDDVHIGACCAIDRGTFGETRIGAGAKLDNHVHIAHNCSIGRNSLLTAGFIVAGSTQIGANFIAGGRSAVTGHVKICDNVHIAGDSGVRKSIDKPGQYGGSPLLPLQKHLQTLNAIRHLHDMRKQLKKVMNHLGMSDEAATTEE